MTIRRGSAHYRLSLAGGGTDLGEGEGLCITLSLPWKCHVTRYEVWDNEGCTVDSDVGPEWVANTRAGASVDDPDWAGYTVCDHPILRHLPNVEPQHHFIVTHEMPTRVGLGSSAALALACVDKITPALAIDTSATGAGWQDAVGCKVWGLVEAAGPSDFGVLDGYPEDKTARISHHNLLLFSTGGTHTSSRNAPELDRMVRKMALIEAHKLRDNPTLDTLAWCMRAQWERKMAHAPDEVCKAIHAASKSPGFMSAKSTGSRGAGFGVVLSTQREKARDALVECGARVWLV